MTPRFSEIITTIGELIEAAGVGIIVIGAIAVTFVYLANLRRLGLRRAYEAYRVGLARSLLLGLELLVAGDIVGTVVVEPTLENAAFLVVIIIARTFLGWTLELEVTGRWPWQRASAGSNPHQHE